MDVIRTVLRGVAMAALLASGTVAAQSTDGYHAIQVFPIAVDTASFTQQFTFRIADYGLTTTTVRVDYFPAEGTADTAPVACPAVELPTQGTRSFASLRSLCPAIKPGSAFGTLVVQADLPVVFAGFSRVSNPAAQGFSVEAFPASDFTAATSVVTGLRRRAASPGVPALQSNCFAGNLGEFAPATNPVPADITITVRDQSGALLGQLAVPSQPGRLTRLLDVFAAAGVPAGNIDDASATFTPTNGDESGLVAFCTVQDNSSFSADFRIAKQEQAIGPGAFDLGAWRHVLVDRNDADVGFSPLFTIPPGATRNTHVFYFRHPDVVGCSLLANRGGPIAGFNYGLEMRLRVWKDSGWEVVAGGNNITQFLQVYLGDKRSHGQGGNTAFMLDVESNGQNEGNARPYALNCFSGSGSNAGDLVLEGGNSQF